MDTILLLHGVMSSAINLKGNKRDLEDLGWPVVALDLPGHGRRSASAGSADSVDGMALDVAGRLEDRRFHVVVGHSLGAVIGLRLARLRPDLVCGVVLGDPAGLTPVDLVQVAAELSETARRARSDAAGEVAALLRRGSTWSRDAAEDAIRSRAAFDAPAISRFLTAQRWDLPELVADCPAPIQLIIATEPDSALRGFDRERLITLIPPDRVRVVSSAHSIHRDRPALWIISVLSLVTALGAD